MTVQQLIVLLQKYPNKHEPVYINGMHEITYISSFGDGLDMRSRHIMYATMSTYAYVDYPDKDIEQCKET